jgi:integrase
MAKRVPALTAAAVAKLKPDPTKTIERVDGAVPGLRLRVSPSGNRSWSLNMRANGVMRRFDVGNSLGLAEARERAEVLRRQIKDGADPTKERRANRAQAIAANKGIGTFEAVIEAYFNDGAGAGLRTKAEQVQRIKSVFGKHLARPAMEITSAELQHVIDGHLAKVAAARAVGYVVPAIKWAKKRGLMQGAFDLDKPLLDAPRQAVLTPDEIAALLPSFADAYGRCCRFMLLTGARRDEARNAKWGQFDLSAGTWTMPAEQRKDTRAQGARRMKPKGALTIPLSRQAIELLEQVRDEELSRRQLDGQSATPDASDLVFVGQRGARLGNWDRWLKANTKATGINGWSAHTLRRTTATLAGELGVPPHVVSVMLGHSNVGGQLVSGYNKSRYLAEHAEALQKIADYLDEIAGLERG